MASTTTKISDLINPEVMRDMISAKIPQKIVVAPFAKVDDTLVGQPGDTITVPQFAYIGDAVDVAEGVAAETVKLATSTTQVKVKKAMKAVELTDEAVLSGYGNPVGETNAQIAKSIAAKVDNDCIDALYFAQLFYDGSGAQIGYDTIVDAIDVFEEELNTEKVMFVNPKQVKQEQE
ncbi:N4-gp56 family major capsid protein [Clostridium botulinum]|uniref:N4-gp56 family major capsid protein n=1 Tax=Clostridium botulinum TaxID=1491 RepID=UPI0007731D65|nr:N4-gp56 family major capsid protein [Clostridium botulinum]